MKKQVLTALIIGSVLGSPAGEVAAATTSGWWTFQANPEHTGLSPGGLPKSLKVRWNRALVASGTVALSPAVFGADKIYVGTGYGNGRIYALNPQDGKTVWSFAAPAGNGFFGAPAAVDGKVYAATLGQSPHVYALDQAKGGLVWQTPLKGVGSRASVTVGDGRVYVNTDAHQLYALDQVSGKVLWTSGTSPGTTSQGSSPAFAAGKGPTVFLASDNGLFAFDAANGKPIWKFPLKDIPGFSSAVLHRGAGAGKTSLVLIGTNDRLLNAVDAASGKGVWRFTGNATLAFSSVAVGDGKVFLFNFQNVTALDAITGKVAWNYLAPAIPRHSPALANGVLYYLDDASVVRGISMSTGAPVWNAPVPGNGAANAPGNSLAMGFEMLIVPNKGHVYAFR